MMKCINLYGLVIMTIIMIPNILFSLMYKNGFEDQYYNNV